MYKLNIENNNIQIGDNINYDFPDATDFEALPHIVYLEANEVENLRIEFESYPDYLAINIDSPNKFNTGLFSEAQIEKQDKYLSITFKGETTNKYWAKNYGTSTFLGALSDVIKDCEDVYTEYIDIQDDEKDIEVSFLIAQDFIVNEIIDIYSLRLKELILQTERILSGAVWKKEYETDEILFCKELLLPLLRKMDFTDIRFTHGKKEYGKDFTFSEPTKFGNLQHYGLQAKAGDISGKVNAPIDEIIGQLDDAFSMPYFEISANESRQISIFIVAISGKYTENAKEKIANKIRPTFKGSVYFLDKDKILELIEKYWK
jgi:hypothetical protein